MYRSTQSLNADATNEFYYSLNSRSYKRVIEPTNANRRISEGQRTFGNSHPASIDFSLVSESRIEGVFSLLIFKMFQILVTIDIVKKKIDSLER